MFANTIVVSSVKRHFIREESHFHRRYSHFDYSIRAQARLQNGTSPKVGVAMRVTTETSACLRVDVDVSLWADGHWQAYACA